jgi:undecaprenyl-diphosphatase
MNKYRTFFWILLVIVSFAKILYIGWGPLDLVPDEAQYWDWSRNLDICYYSKGPFIAYNIFFGTFLGKISGITLSNPSFWVRFSAVLNSILLGIVFWFLAKRIWKDERAAFYTILILTAIPLYAIGSIIMTIDNPLLLFWVLYLYLVFAALETGKGWYWFFSGIVLGLGFLSKYAMIALIPCVILYLLFTSKHRYWLKRKEFYTSLLVGILFFTPVLIWNVKHDWIGMRHVAGQAGLGDDKPFFSPHFFEFIGIQAGIISPVLFFILIASFVKTWKLRVDYRYSFLFWMGVPVGIFYLFLSLHEYCQANWPAPVYLSGAIIAGNLFKGSKILKTGIIVGVVMWLVVFCIDLLLPFSTKFNPVLRLKGWRKLGCEVGKVKNDLQKDGRVFILSDRYQITSELAFYVPGNPRVYCANFGRRMNQYDLWEGIEQFKGYNAIYVKHRDQELEPEMLEAFLDCKKLPLVKIMQDKQLLHEYSIFVCRGFKGNLRQSNETSY